MQITLLPMRHDQMLVAQRSGDVLVLNGRALDFGPLPEGAVLPQDAMDCPWIASDVTRVGGRLQLALILPHGPAAPEQSLFPAPITVLADGPIALPPYDAAPVDDPAHDDLPQEEQI